MKPKFSPTIFMLAYCVVYCAALITDLPAFRYYPLTGHLNWGAGKVEGMGPGMAWYGILLEAAVIAAIAAFVVPGEWLTKRLRNFLWIAPLGAMVLSVYLMKGFFA